MAVPVLASAGNGATNTSVTSLDVPYPAAVDANDLLVLHMGFADTGETITTPSGWTRQSGPDDDANGLRQYLFYKLAAGSEDGTNLTVSFSGSASLVFGRMYRFTGTATSTPLEVVAATTGSGSTLSMPSLTTSATDELCIALFLSDASGDPGNPTGETGGDWVEGVAQYQTGLGQLNIFTASKATAGSISGGSVSNSNGSVWAGYGFAIKSTGGAATVTGSSSLTLTAGITTTGFKSTTGSSASTITVGIVSAGARQVSGSSAQTVTVGIVSSGTRTTFGASATTVTDGIVSSGTRTTFGSSASTVTVGITSTASTTTVAGSASLTVTVGLTSSGAKSTAASASLGLNVNITTVGVRGKAITLVATSNGSLTLAPKEPGVLP